MRNARAFPLLPAALASVPFGFVLVRVRLPPPSKVDTVHDIILKPDLSRFCVCFCIEESAPLFTNDQEWHCLVSSAVTKKTAGFPGFYVFTHLGSAEDPVITNNAEGKPKENPTQMPRGFSWLLVINRHVSRHPSVISASHRRHVVSHQPQHPASSIIYYKFGCPHDARFRCS